MRVTPSNITKLGPSEIFVFGSNLKGHHNGGAARLAFQRFGAIYGRGIGLQGSSYAIPTMFESHMEIKPYVDDFIKEAETKTEEAFLVTEIGCGIAGFTPEQIAPLFEKATKLENVFLPNSFWEVLKR